MNDEKDPQGNPWIKSAMIWAGVIVALLLFVSLFDSRTATTAGTGIAYSEFRSKVQEGQVKDVAIASVKAGWNVPRTCAQRRDVELG